MMTEVFLSDNSINGLYGSTDELQIYNLTISGTFFFFLKKGIGFVCSKSGSWIMEKINKIIIYNVYNIKIINMIY
jgi:uncharacterized membrane protein SirB2